MGMQIEPLRIQAEPLALVNFDLLDVESGVITRRRSLTIENGRITRLGSGAPECASNVRRIDLGGRMVLPGLIDCHVHILQSIFPESADFLPSFLTAAAVVRLGGMLDKGFTTVRDAGGADAGHRQAVARGIIRGPRLFVAGRALSQTGGHGDARSMADMLEPCGCAALLKGGIGRIVNGVPEVLHAVRDEIRMGADQIKIMAGGGVGSPHGFLEYDQFTDAEIAAVVDEARRARRYVMAHVYSAEGVTRLVRLGVRSIEHGNLVDDAAVKEMRSAGAYLVANLIVYDVIAKFGREHGFPEEGLARLQTILDAGTRSIELADHYGVKIGYGSDLVKAPEFQSEEFLIRGRVQKPIDVIRSATLVGAEIVGRAGELGVVKEGALADLIVVNGNPLEDLRFLAEQGAHIPMVIKDGRIEKQVGLT
jgi:imidazolonepropionase-like amidohydrolase